VWCLGFPFAYDVAKNIMILIVKTIEKSNKKTYKKMIMALTYYSFYNQYR
jgi:hypothetical protein